MILSALLAVQQAVASGPPIPYWQQEVAYEISARLDEPAGVLGGTERILYHNRSPDTLETFSLHLYLNAFRPGSRWADADSAEGRRRFNDLRDPDFAFNHVRDVRIMGQPVEAIYPFAPDSTVVRFVLPEPLAPGDSMTVEMGVGCPALDGAAPPGAPGPPIRLRAVVSQGRRLRPVRLGGASALPRGRVLRRVRLVPRGSRPPDDQVMGATGVPVCGDPGWERANQNPQQPVEYQRDYYGANSPPDNVLRGAGPGRKKIRWYAENVHHFAMSLNPAYRYEGGHFGNVAVHVLYQPGDEKTWGAGVAVGAHPDRARLARSAVRSVRLAADHQRAPDRGWRHRVPHDDPRRLRRSGTDRARARPQLHHGTAGEQRVARGMARRGIHQLPDHVVLGGDGKAERLSG